MRREYTSRPHDQQVIDWIVKKPNAGIFLDPGMGKTSSTCHAFLELRRKKKVRNALVLAPLRPAQLVWTQEPGGELAEWESLKDLKVVLLHGKDKTERLREPADLYIVNYDGLKWLHESGGLLWLLREMDVDTLVLDELSKLKHTSSQRFKLLKHYLPLFKRRIGLTGTPASNGLMGLFGQAYCLDLGQALGEFITHYRNTYFHSPARYVWTPYKESEKQIVKALKPLALSIRAEDVGTSLGLPDQLTHDIWVDLPPDARKIYDELKRDMCVLLDDDSLAIAGSAAILAGKCRQVASGGLYHHPEPTPGLPAPERETRQLHDVKTDALEELVEELQGQPLLVAYEYEHDLERLRARFPTAELLGGGSTLKHAQRVVEAWNARKLPLLLAHPAAMGHGLNLQKGGSHVCWYSLTWDLDLYEQLNRRLRRPGNTAATVIVHRLLARNTVDQAVAMMLTQKRMTQEDLLNALRRFHR